MKARTLGAIIAGGRSSRFGEPKALAPVGGRRIIDRVGDTLSGVASEIVVIANDADIANAVPWPSRPDAIEGAGALGGVLTALLWAAERDGPGVLAVACDMPFVSHQVLRSIVDRTAGPGSPWDVVVPGSGGPRGVEPLCAWYSVNCIGPIRDALDRGDQRMIGFHEAVRVCRIPIDEVRAVADPDIAFMNVNTRDDIERAERLAQAVGS